MKRLILATIVMVSGLILMPWAAVAAVPQVVPYQGQLSDSAGVPTNGVVSMTFKLYSMASGGVATWTETHLGVNVSKGLFNVHLGSVRPFPIGVFSTSVWLGVAVATDPEMSPRRALTSVPFALHADDADTVGGFTRAQLQGATGPAGSVGPKGAAGIQGPAGSPDTAAQVKAKLVKVDGTGSGVDADLLDGNHATAFARAVHAHNKYVLKSGGVMTGALSVVTAAGPAFSVGVGGSMFNVNASTGFVGVGRTLPMNGSEAFGVTATADRFGWGGMYIDAQGSNVPGSKPLPYYGYAFNGAPSGVYHYVNGNTGDWVMHTKVGNALIVKNAMDVDVGGAYLSVNGRGGEQAYIGGDGAGNDVQVGSTNAAVTSVSLYNRTNKAFMRLIASSIQLTGGADLAEPFKVGDGKVAKPGMVVSIDADHPGELLISQGAYDHKVAGILSGANGVNPGLIMNQDDVFLDGTHPVALAGRVYVWADASSASIRPGDLLTTSDNPGYAMKAIDHEKSQGAILGKAMSSLDRGTGLILVLVSLQ